MALQERELSPQILWCFRHMLSFECEEIWTTEAEPRGQIHLLDDFGVRDRNLYKSLGLGQRTGDPYLLPRSQHAQPYVSWRTVVEEYSSRELTWTSDKHPALSGLTHLVQPVGSQYAAGLWVNDFLRGLLWRRLRLNSASLSRAFK